MYVNTCRTEYVNNKKKEYRERKKGMDFESVESNLYTIKHI